MDDGATWEGLFGDVELRRLAASVVRSDYMDTNAAHPNSKYELADYNREDLVFTKEMLLAEPVERTPLRREGE